MVGLIGGVFVYSCYAFATQSWMMYVGIIGWAVAAFTWPSLNAMMSQQVPANAQGELQGGLASLGSLSAILGPPIMTQLFGAFSSASAPVQFPGAPFLAAAILALASAVMLIRITATSRQVAAVTQ